MESSRAINGSLRDGVRSVYRRSSATFTRGPLRALFPYGSHAAAVWSILAPGLLIVVGLAAVAVPTQLRVFATSLTNEPLVAAALVSIVYAVSVLTYRPIDKNDYGSTRMPTAYEEFEHLLTVMGFGALPLSYVLFLWSDSLGQVVGRLGVSSFIAAIGVGTLGLCITYAWLKHRYGHSGTNPELASFWGFVMFGVPAIGLYVAQIPLGVDILLVGSPDAPLQAALVPAFVVLALVLRRLRWTVYEDSYGFRGVDPFVPLWGIPRVAFVFGVVALHLGAPLSESVLGASFAPVIGAIAYLGWRAYVTGDLKAPPNGWISSPGRKVYEDMRRENAEKTTRIRRVREPVETFNVFAESHGLDTVEEPSVMSFSPPAIKRSLSEIHEEQVRGVLSGEDYNEFARLRREIERELSK